MLVWWGGFVLRKEDGLEEDGLEEVGEEGMRLTKMSLYGKMHMRHGICFGEERACLVYCARQGFLGRIENFENAVGYKTGSFSFDEHVKFENLENAVGNKT